MSFDSVAREMNEKFGGLIRAAAGFAVAKAQKKDFTAEKAAYEKALLEFEAKLAKFKAEV